MKLVDLLYENREKALLIRKYKKLRAKRYNPKASKTNILASSGSRPHDPSSGIGGEDAGTGLYS